MIAERLEPFDKRELGDYQRSLRQNRSTTDQMFAILSILERLYKLHIDVHQLCMDSKQAYNNIDRVHLYENP